MEVRWLEYTRIWSTHLVTTGMVPRWGESPIVRAHFQATYTYTSLGQMLGYCSEKVSNFSHMINLNLKVIWKKTAVTYLSILVIYIFLCQVKGFPNQSNSMNVLLGGLCKRKSPSANCAKQNHPSDARLTSCKFAIFFTAHQLEIWSSRVGIDQVENPPDVL